MADLPGDLALRLADRQRAARGFQGVAERLAEDAIAGDLVIGQGPPQELQLRRDDFARADRRVRGHVASLAQLGQKLSALDVPGPFLELKAEAVDLLVEDALRIDI